MLAGYLPFADQIEDSDVIIISKDGVHLYQASAAGIGGGLRYWVETEDEIYRVADITALSALTYDPTEPVYKYTWHGAPMSTVDITKAVYTALDSTGKQPSWLIPEGNILSQAVNEPDIPIRSVTATLVPLPVASSYENHYPYIPIDYCRDFNKIYVGWTEINVTGYDDPDMFQDCTGNDPLSLISDLNWENESWHNLCPVALRNLAGSTGGSSVAFDNDEELYNALSSAIDEEYNTYDPEGDSYYQHWPNRLNYDLTDTPAGRTSGETFYNDATTGDYYDGRGGTLLEDLNTRCGFEDDSVSGSSVDYEHAGIGYKAYFYDRRIGRYGNKGEIESYRQQREALIELAAANWAAAYDPDTNPHPGGFEDEQDYESWFLAANLTSFKGGGYGIGKPGVISHGLETKARPFIVMISCVGYYPNYTLKPISGDPVQDIDYPNGNNPNTQGELNFPGYKKPIEQGYSQDYEADGAIANFSDSNNHWSQVPGTNIQRMLRGHSICVDYKDDSGYIWEICLFATSENYISGTKLSTGDPSKPIFKLVGANNGEDIVYTELDHIDLDSTLTHWSYNEDIGNYVSDHYVISKSEYDVTTYAYSTPNEGYGQVFINNARNIAATIVREVGFKVFRPFEGEEIKVRTNIGINDNNGFKTGVEVTDYDNVKKFDPTSYIDPVTGSAWFKGMISENGTPLSSKYQKKMVAGTGVTITRGTDYDTISMGGSGELDTVFELLEKGDGITPVKDLLHNKIKHDLNHAIEADINQDILTVTRSHERDQERQLTNKIIDTIGIDAVEFGNAIYDKIIKGKGIQFVHNNALGTTTIKTEAVTEVRVNGSAVEKHDLPNDAGEYVDLVISAGGDGDDFDITLPVPDYANKQLINTLDYTNGSTYTAPADGVLYLYNHYGQTCLLPATVGSFTYKFGQMDSSSFPTYNEFSNMLPLKKGDVVTFGSRQGSFTNTTTTNGAILYFIPFETAKVSELNSVYPLPSINYDTLTEVISQSNIPYNSGEYYTYTATVDSVVLTLNNTSSGYFEICPLDDQDAIMHTFYLNYISVIGSGGGQFDCIPLRKGKKYKIRRSASSKTGDLYIMAFETVSDLANLYYPYPNYSNPTTITPTTGSSYANFLPNDWDTSCPFIFVDTVVGISYNQGKMTVQTATGGRAWPLQHRSQAYTQTMDSCYNYIPLRKKATYDPSCKLEASNYGSGDITLLKYQKFALPKVKRVLYDGVNLVDSNGDVDLTFLKQLIDGLDARITALGG